MKQIPVDREPCSVCNGEGDVPTPADQMTVTVNSEINCTRCGGYGYIAKPEDIAFRKSCARHGVQFSPSND